MRSHFLRATQPDSPPESPFTLVGSSTVGTSTSGGTISATIPAGRMAGDFILVVHAVRSTSDLDMSLADGSYTKVADLYGDDSFDANLGVHWKIADGTEVSVLLPGGAGFVIATCSVQVWRGVDYASPLDVAPATAIGKDSGIPVGPAITTVSPGCLIVTAVAAMTGTGTTVITPPTAFTNDTTAPYPGGSFPTRAGIASKEIAGAGAASVGAWSHGFSNTLQSWCACTLALRPA